MSTGLATRIGRRLVRGAKWARKGVGRQVEGVVKPSKKGAKHLRKKDLPVYEAVRRFAKRPVHTARKEIRRMKPGEKALFGGLTALEAPGALKKGPDRGERAGQLAGSTAGWLALRRVPLVGAMLGWEAMGRLGGAAGKAIGGR